MSTVTIFCREGACNVENHTPANCHNRYVATRRLPGPPLSRRDWDALAALTDRDLTGNGPELTGRQR